MIRSLFFYKELTPAEVGATQANETYIRLNNSFDHVSFFQGKAVEKNTVVECTINATNITNNEQNGNVVTLRFVYYVNNKNKEKRIPSLTSLFSSNNVSEGDVVCLECRKKNNEVNYFIKFIPKGAMHLFGQTLFFESTDQYTLPLLDTKSQDENNSDAPRQIIWYGAPGTGKSFTVNNVTNKSNSVRTTFHPDTDYASFVGTYKPTLRPVKPMYQNIQGRDEEISYKFTPQVFLKAYVNAWRNYAENPDNPTPYYLVIEEINRGNCAQIFGDLFQLLDREDNGASTYEIVPDTDIEKFLKEDEDGFVKEEAVEDFTVDIKEGKILRLPSNLFIYATMNTSDQSLFPIDSAFKRRWEWRYTPIAKPAEKNWTISANNSFWSWWEFLKRINFEIGKATESEDKKLGYFFARAKRADVADIDNNNNNGTIEASTFVSKVLFYLWNDVIKDNDFNTDILKDANGKDLDFTRFFKVVNGETKIDEVLVENFITNVMNVQLPDEPEVVEEIQDNSSKSTFSINDELVNSLSSVASTTIKKYIELNQTATADDVFNAWSPYSQYSTHSWIISKDEKTKRAERLQCGDGSFVWVNKDGWMRLPNSLNRDTIQEFMDAVNSADFGITIIENKE